jgi:3-phosphoshikimate 1-carboxyvinyltransferase
LPDINSTPLLNSVTILKQSVLQGIAKTLPSSKSISNRVLIINALAEGGSSLHNLSDANDTQLMLRLVNSQSEEIDVEDAGTTMRFLTAYFSVRNEKKIMTGSHRMKERPIALLIEALRSLGAEIEYMGVDGFPPHRLKGFLAQKTSSIKIRGDVSSQYISALMMIGPKLPLGLTLELQGKVGSRPYIEMTASLMKQFGVSLDFTANIISIKPQTYKPAQFTVESDWSGASYWYGFAALAEKAEVTLPRISLNSLQGDRAIVDIMHKLGVDSKVLSENTITLTKIKPEHELHWDFTHCPDLAQTVAVVCAAKGIRGFFTGLESLRIKETDRIAALQNELRKIGADLIEDDAAHWRLIPIVSTASERKF